MSAKTAFRAFRPSSFRSFGPQARRNFITLPGTEAQSLTATRILPYKSSSLYTIIADVDSYSSFLPYCVDSKITKWSEPDTNGTRWPSEADLKVGWGGYEETFTSRLFCVPGSVVEALSGEAISESSKSDVSHHSATFDAPAIPNDIFKSLSTRWTVKPFLYKPATGQPETDKTQHPSRDQTEVHLTINFQFANPIYAALSKAVAPKVASVIIEAFEERVRRLLDGPGSGMQERQPLDGQFSTAKKIGA
jgi:coenzyme Q-binding protein COQ10